MGFSLADLSYPAELSPWLVPLGNRDDVDCLMILTALSEGKKYFLLAFLYRRTEYWVCDCTKQVMKLPFSQTRAAGIFQLFMLM